MISGSNSDEQIEAAQTISSNFLAHVHTDLILITFTIDIAAGPYDLWIKSVSTVPYLISLLDSDNMVHEEEKKKKKRKY